MKKIIFLTTLFLILGISTKAFSLEVPLTITDYAGVERKSEPVTSGVPLPETADIRNPYLLQIFDSEGNQVAAQFSVLARWAGKPNDISKPIKWVLVDFQADVLAGESRTYYLRDKGKGTEPQGNLTVKETKDFIFVDTDKINFSINKNNFSLFDTVDIKERRIIASSFENGIRVGDSTVTKIIGGTGKGSKSIKVVSTSGYKVGDKFTLLGTGREKVITKIKENKIHFKPGLEEELLAKFIRKNPEIITDYYSYLDKPKVTIEEKGPLRVVIKIQGGFKSKDGDYLGQFNDYDKRLSQPYPWVNYTCRIHAYNNKDYVRVFVIFENNGCYSNWPENKFCSSQWLYFEDLVLKLKLNMNGAVKVSTVDYDDIFKSNESFSLHQELSDNRFLYEVKKNNTDSKHGEKNDGWVDIYDVEKGVMVAIRHFWQNYPKAIKFSNNILSLDLWPKKGFYPENNNGKLTDVYQFEGGRHKTYEIMYKFYANSDGKIEPGHFSGILNNPLFALAPSRWYGEFGALGLIGPADLSSKDKNLDWAFRSFEKIQRAKVYKKDSSSGTIYTVREKDKKGYYGWMNFGDLKWANGYCSLHYDWPYSMLLHFIRTGKRNFFDMGVEMARHRYDIDQYHGERVDSAGEQVWNNYLQHYEKGFHGRGEQTPKMSHTWNGGLILNYLLTGDRKSLEAAEEVGKAVFNYKRLAQRPEREARFQGWAILNALNLWQVNGDEAFLNLAEDLALSLVRLEKQSGGKGYIAWDNEGTYTFTQFCLILDPLIQAHYYTQNEEVLGLLVRMNKWLKEDALYGGTSFHKTKWDYMPLQLPYKWRIKGENKGGEIVYNYFTANLPAYIYLQTGNEEDLDLARRIFKDSVFYWQCVGNKLADNNFVSKIEYTARQFPGSNTKVHGWTGKAHQIYLYAEWQRLKKEQKDKK